MTRTRRRIEQDLQIMRAMIDGTLLSSEAESAPETPPVEPVGSVAPPTDRRGGDGSRTHEPDRGTPNAPCGA